MTLQMIIALAILAIMIILIMTEALPFGAPPLFACCLLVAAGTIFGADWETQWDIPYAFAGFTNQTVWMVAFFMAIITALQKTRLIGSFKRVMEKLVEKGGYKSYVLLVIVVMIGAGVIGGTAYYMLVLNLVAAIPYNKKLPTSKLLMPLGFATMNPLIPLKVATIYGLASSVLESAGIVEAPEMMGFTIMFVISSLGYLFWSVVSYNLLPDHPLAEQAEHGQVRMNKSGEDDYLPRWKELVIVVACLVGVAGMMFASDLGNVAYVIPGLGAFVLLFCKIISFKEMRESIFSPVILMMAGVIPIANALADSGFTGMVGQAVAGFAGEGMPGFVIVLAFCLLAGLCSTFTGSNMGSAFIFAPIAVATCMSLGFQPQAAAAGVTLAAFSGGFMPIDGLPALIMGMGNYTLIEFWKFSVPMWFVKLVFLAAGACIAFPM